MFDQPFIRPAPIQGIDPRLRLAFAGLAALCLAVLQSLEAALGGLGLGLGLLLLSHPPLKALARRLLAVNIFILFIWLLTPLTMPGESVARWGWLSVSHEGLLLSLLVTLKSNAIVCVFLALVSSLEPSRVGCALERLHCPPKLVFLLLSTIRQVHVLAGEWQRLSVAARLRAFVPRTSRHSYRTLASLLGLLLVRAYERSLRVREAMLLRGFQGRFGTVSEFHARPVDALFALVLLLCLGGIVWLECHARGLYV